LSLSGTTFSLDGTYTDGRYVLKSGDTMTGGLTAPNLNATGTATARTLSSRSGSILSIYGDSDIEVQIDRAGAGIFSYFEIFNGAGSHVFFVDESGNSRTFGNHTVDGTVSADAFSGNGLGLTSAGLVRATVLNPPSTSLGRFSTTFVKLSDIGSFTKQLAGSTIEVTHNGRIYVGSFDAGATGAAFELRVDNAAVATAGPAQAIVRTSEAGGGGVQVSITGIFTGLSAGNHTVSIWVKGCWGGGSSAYLDPGSFDSDHTVIKELK
jgi:hypothetical protein